MSSENSIPDKGVNNNEVAEWKLSSENRLKMIQRIMEILRKRFRDCEPLPVEKIQSIAEVFEERIYQLSNTSAEYVEMIRRKLQGRDRSDGNNEPDVSQSNTSTSSVPFPASVIQSQAHQQNSPLQVQNGTGAARARGSEASSYVRPSASGLPHVPLLKTVDRDSGLLNLSKNPEVPSANYQTALQGRQRVTEAPMPKEQQSRHVQQGSIQRQLQPHLLNLSKMEDNTQSSSSMPIQIQHGRLPLLKPQVQPPPLMHSTSQSARQSSSSQGSQAESAQSSGFSASQQSTQSKLVKLPQTVPRQKPQRQQQARSSLPEEGSRPSAQERPLVSQSQLENMPSRLPNKGKITPASDTRPVTPSSLRDKIYEKAQHLQKEYWVELIELCQKITAELKKQKSVQQNVNEGRNKERDRELRKVVEAMSILSRNKDAIMPGYEDRLEFLEELVLCMRNLKRTISSQPQGQQLASKVGPIAESQVQNVSPVNTKTENSPSDVPSTTQARSVNVGNPKTPVSDVPKDETVNEAVKPSTPVVISTPGMTASPMLATYKEPEKSNISAIHRLVKAVKNISPNALVACASAIHSVIENTDGIPLPPPISGSGVISEDMRARFSSNWYDSIERRNLKRCISPVSFNAMSASGGLDDYSQQFTDIEPQGFEPTAVFQLKRQRTEAKHYLLEEIRKINQKLVDTNVLISEEAWNRAQGTVVSCCYNAIAVSPDLKAKQPPIEPLRLLVPINYPYCSPVLQDKLPTGFMTTHNLEEQDVSANAKLKFKRDLRVLEQPMSLTEIAKTWDTCARAAMTEYAAQYGGGTFSSKYGDWEKNCIRAD